MCGLGCRGAGRVGCWAGWLRCVSGAALQAIFLTGPHGLGCGMMCDCVSTPTVAEGAAVVGTSKKRVAGGQGQGVYNPSRVVDMWCARDEW